MDQTTELLLGNGSTASLYLSSTHHHQIYVAQVSKCSQDYPECVATRYLWIVFCPVLLLLGTFGNIMIMAVMSHPSLRRTAFGCYLIGMAIMDLTAIWVGLTRHFIKNVWAYDIRESHQAVCWLLRLLLYGSLNTSVWLLTSVTFERTLSIYSPARSIKFKNLKRTKIIIAAVIVIQFGWNLQVFFTRGVEYYADGSVDRRCGYPSKAAEFYWDFIHSYVVMFDYSIIPFILMLVMNLAIFIRLRKRDNKYKACASVKNGKNQVISSNVSHKTLMLLPASIFFLITTLPSLAFTGVEMSVKTEGQDRARMELADFVVSTLMYLNHSVTFLLYCLTGKIFRARCWALLTSCLMSRTEMESTWETKVARSTPLTSGNFSSTSHRSKSSGRDAGIEDLQCSTTLLPSNSHSDDHDSTISES